MRSPRPLRIVLACVALAALASLLFLPVKEPMARFLEWSRGLGAWGPVVVALVYVPACVLLLPGSILTLGAGFAFGIVRGTIAVSVGSTLGVSAAFLTSRWLARGAVERRIESHVKFRALDDAVRRDGFKVVLLTRLSPIFPFNFLNYAYGLTKVRFRDFVLGSWIGMFPGTVLYVYLGSALGSLSDLGAPPDTANGGNARKVFVVVGLVATVAVTILITRSAKRALRDALSTGASPSDAPPTLSPEPVSSIAGETKGARP